MISRKFTISIFALFLVLGGCHSQQRTEYKTNKQIVLSWKSEKTPQNLQLALRTLSEDYPLVENAAGNITITFKKITAAERTFKISKQHDVVIIEYSDLPAALRAVGSVLSQADTNQEQTSFETFGIMLDCSRNAVIKVDRFKGWLRKLALLGYNMAMLYCEDTYQLPDEPYFGYQRGAYSADELREIDQYASKLGIEMIPCIQTLGHLNQVTKWNCYSDITDVQGVLLVGEPKTYALIEKMIKFWSGVFKSRRIHVGMDETFGLGEGQYKRIHGVKRGFDIFNEHLNRVSEICKKYKYKPMIWSDRYFVMASKTGGYYDKTSKIPDDVKAAIPKSVQLVFWDYKHNEPEDYMSMIEKHRNLGFDPLVASCIWTQHVLWYDKKHMEQKAGACIEGSRKSQIKEILFTIWGDDGAYCDFDSAMAGLTWAADLSYTGKTEQANLEKRFSAICHGDYEATSAAADLYITAVPAKNQSSPVLLWEDDPLFNLYNYNLQHPDFWPKAQETLRSMICKLENSSAKSADGGDLQYALILSKMVLNKIELQEKLRSAYSQKDKQALAAVAGEIPVLIDLIEKTQAAFETQWLRRNKPFGLDLMQSRFAGLARRYRELSTRINELLNGNIDVIEEFENRPKEPIKGL